MRAVSMPFPSRNAVVGQLRDVVIEGNVFAGKSDYFLLDDADRI